MKKLLLLVFVVGAIFAFNSCDPGENGYHTFQVLYPKTSPYVYQFGDQTEDTIVLYTSEAYTTSVDADWVTVLNNKTGTVSSEYLAISYPITMSMKPNTTGKTRTCNLKITTTSKNWNNTITVKVVQMPWHYLGWPSPEYSSDLTTAKMEVTDSATQEIDGINFKAFDDWTIEVKDPETSFLHPVKTSGTRGLNKIQINMDENKSKTDTLRGILYLKSRNGVTTTVKYNKAPAK